MGSLCGAKASLGTLEQQDVRRELRSTVRNWIEVLNRLPNIPLPEAARRICQSG